MMFKALNEAFVSELVSIKNSYYKLLLITILPITSFALIIAIFYNGVARDMPIVVVDKDKSKLSRLLLTNIQSSSTIEIAFMRGSLKDAMELVQKGDAYGVVIIPSHFQKDIMLQKQPHVTAMLNTQFILIGKILTSALSKVVMQSAGTVEYVKTLSSVKIPYEAKISVAPINIQITPFFNTYQNYFLFLVSALIPAIWQIFIVVATIVSFGSMFKMKKEGEFFKDSHVEMRIIGKLLPYTISYMLLGIGYLFYIYGTLGWAFEGSFSITIFGLFLTTVAYQGIALLIFSVGFDYARALSAGAFYTAPAFAFLGITFPVYNMNSFAIFWRDILPLSHYMELQISQANYGASVLVSEDKLLVLFSFWIVFIPLFFIFRKRLGR